MKCVLAPSGFPGLRLHGGCVNKRNSSFIYLNSGDEITLFKFLHHPFFFLLQYVRQSPNGQPRGDFLSHLSLFCALHAKSVRRTRGTFRVFKVAATIPRSKFIECIGHRLDVKLCSVLPPTFVYHVPIGETLDFIETLFARSTVEQPH